MNAILIRLEENSKATLGHIYIYEGLSKVMELRTLERTDKIIPSGTYSCDFTFSPKFKENLFLINNVPKRAGIRIHRANYYDELEGCIALGYDFEDINNDNVFDVTSSKLAVHIFNKVMPPKFTLTIL